MVVADGVLLLLLLLAGYKGYKDGLLVTLIGFFAFILGVLSAFKLMHSSIALLKPYVKETSWLPFIAFVTITVLVYVGVLYLGRFIKNSMEYTLLGGLDAIGGAILAGLKMLFIISIWIWFVDLLHVAFLLPYVEKSLAFPFVRNFAPTVVHWVSYVIPFQDVFQAIKDSIQGK